MAEFNFRRWRMLLQIFAIIGNPETTRRRIRLERISQAKFTKLVMMPVAFSVGGDISERSRVFITSRGALQPVNEGSARIQRIPKCDPVGELLIIKENSDGPSRAIPM